eukprot:scaffold48873_cov33-Prasinocladus_malaysianus.AAC.2
MSCMSLHSASRISANGIALYINHTPAYGRPHQLGKVPTRSARTLPNFVSSIAANYDSPRSPASDAQMPHDSVC